MFEIGSDFRAATGGLGHEFVGEQLTAVGVDVGLEPLQETGIVAFGEVVGEAQHLVEGGGVELCCIEIA